jgi:hypothetical protein
MRGPRCSSTIGCDVPRDRSLMPIEGKPVDDARLAMPRRLTGLSDHA